MGHFLSLSLSVVATFGDNGTKGQELVKILLNQLCCFLLDQNEGT
jgi:hypothetical protein